jgi:hypothetical protein
MMMYPVYPPGGLGPAEVKLTATSAEADWEGPALFVGVRAVLLDCNGFIGTSRVHL